VQRNAACRTWGAMQSLRYALTRQQELRLSAWYTDHRRQLQPDMPSNLDASKYDSIADKNLRANLSHSGSFGRTSTLATVGYCYDKENFRSDVIAAHNLLGVVEAEHLFGSYLRLKGGVSPQRISPTGSSYASGVVEWRTDLYAMSSAKFVDERLHVNLSARQSLITHLAPPTTYAAGVGYAVVKGSEHLLKLNIGTSTSYRAPTINERYWGKSINSYLNPERSKNVEGGAQYRFDGGRSEAAVTAGVYRNLISDWIRWMPYGHIWKPINLQRVRAQGLDVTANGSCQAAALKLSLYLTYAYSLVTVVNGGTRYATLNGYQMAYSPKYRGSGTLVVAYKSTSLSANAAYVGLTHSSDIFDIIPSYTLLNLSAAQALSVAAHRLEAQVSVNNLLDKSYQSVKYFAMPGINFECTLKYYFLTSNKQKS